MQLKLFPTFLALCAVPQALSLTFTCKECVSNCGRQTTRLTMEDDGKTWSDGTLHRVKFGALSGLNIPPNVQLTITRPGKTEVFAIQYQKAGLKRYYLNGGATCLAKWDTSDKAMQIFVGPAP